MITCPPRPRPDLCWPSRSVGKTSISNSTTWKGTRTDSDEPEPLEDDLSDLITAAQEHLERGPGVEDPESVHSGELVERADFFSYILLAPGLCLADFKVSVLKDEFRLEAPTFELAKRLGCEVHPEGVAVDYRNGVFSVRVPKKP